MSQWLLYYNTHPSIKMPDLDYNDNEGIKKDDVRTILSRCAEKRIS